MTATTSQGRGRPDRRRVVRPEIQALRAVAVAFVVVYHLWPEVLPGGYVGVDVFFGISGFLITLQLLREADRTGRVSLIGFWARRARRILPAALVTLLFCAVATMAVVPESHWERYFAEIRAATLYVENWYLADAAVDYLRAEDAPSVVQHFWSLSAEEQFYVVWPVLIAGALWLAARRGDGTRMRMLALGIALSALTIASFAYSVRYTAADPAAAFFVSPTRAWQFGLGGLLALFWRARELPAPLRSAVSWVGIAAIVVSAVAYSTETPFPGYAALLPVAGTLAVIWAGAPQLRWAPTRVMSLRPVQFLGDVSYSAYLWHWPLIVLIPFATGRDLDAAWKVAIVAGTVLIAWGSKVMIEDPVRHGSFLVRRPARWTLASAATASAVIVAIAATGSVRVGEDIEVARAQTRAIVAAKPTCFGAAARDPQRTCANPKLAHTVVPSPIEAHDEPEYPCPRIRARRPEICAFGVPASQAVKTVALVGDSHAVHWRVALGAIAKQRKWRVVAMYQSQCPFTRAIVALRGSKRAECAQWNRDVAAWISRHPEVSTVIVSSHRGAGVVVPSGRTSMETKVAGFLDAWNALPESVRQVVVIKDVPYNDDDTLDCVQRAMEKRKRPGVACAIPRSVALKPDPAALAAEQRVSERVHLLDFTSFMCDSRRCPPVIGGVLVRKDIGHMTRTFARTLAPYLAQSLKALDEGAS